jgi:AraC family transcriptional regulator
MREEGALGTIGSINSRRAEEITRSRDSLEASYSVPPIATAWERVEHFVRQAMTTLESDGPAALQCLHVASTLLSSGLQDSRTTLALAQYVFRPGGLVRWQAKRVIAYIETHLGSKMQIRDLADLLGLSKSHFSRAFRLSLGLPPKAYVATQRVERAKLMMISTGERLIAIAAECGFADQSHLNRCFRRQVGVSPGMWRRANVGRGHSPMGLADAARYRGRAHDSGQRTPAG